MKRLTSVLLLVLLALAAAFTSAQQQQPTVATTNLKVGDTAPDFKLKDQSGKTIQLSKYRGKKSVVVAFYVLAFTGG